MNCIDKLLQLDEMIEVCKDSYNKVCVSYKNAYISDGTTLLGVCGRGVTFDEACENYREQISGKRLVFDPGTSYRREARILI